MNLLNRALALSSIVVLTLTIAILFWLRGRVSADLEGIVSEAVDRFDAPAVLHEPTDPSADFASAEAFADAVARNRFVRRLIVTKRRFGAPEGRDELPVVPFRMAAVHGEAWRDELAGMTRVALRGDDLTYGYLYFDLDRSELRSVNFAIGATALSLIATLLLLIGRLYRQETSLVRVGGELAQRKRELIRIERLALAGQLSANLLHDLKKPVSNIRHSLEELQTALGDFAGSAVALREIRMQADLFFNILSDSQIERFVRSDRVQDEYVDVNEIVEFSLRLVHYERGGVEIRRDMASGLPSVLAQPFRLIQVISNLVLNAYQAMDGQGVLEVRTRAEEGGIRIEVVDDGPGIEEALLAQVFEAFFTTKAEADGSGLGLAICQMIVDDMHGRIGVTSRVGEHTRFWIWLPTEESGEGEHEDGLEGNSPK